MGNLIKDIIDARVMSQKELSEQTGLSIAKISAFAEGRETLPQHLEKTLDLLASFSEDITDRILSSVQPSPNVTRNEHSEDISIVNFLDYLTSFDRVGRKTETYEENGVRYFINDFWTSRQRQSDGVHEISYRACFKGELPNFFIQKLTQPGDWVLDPFMGRGTTLVEAALLRRRAAGNDINPLSKMLVEPRLCVPSISDIARRLDEIDLKPQPFNGSEDLLAFFHPKTLGGLIALRDYFLNRVALGTIDQTDKWIRMVAINRLTGHSSGFFSVYTLPPNQAVTVKRQIKINEKRDQKPEPRDIRAIILKKSKSLLRGNANLIKTDFKTQTGPASQLKFLSDETISLSVTSPPFLDVVDYAGDNWLRAWFAGFDVRGVDISIHKSVEAWTEFTADVLRELYRVTKPGGFVAYEVGEVRNASIKLEQQVIQAAEKTSFQTVGVMIHDQKFSKTANAWGVSNNKKGTNTNRIVILVKPIA